MIKKLLNYFGYKVVKAATWLSSSIGGFYGSYPNAALEKVDNESILHVSTVYSAIRNISEDVAKIPLKVYKKGSNSREERPDHPLWDLLNYQPNEYMTAQAFRESQNSHMMGWGNGFSEIVRDYSGTPVGIYPLRTDRVSVERDSSGGLIYRVATDSGTERYIEDSNVLHLHGLGYDGILGYNIVQFMAETAGASIAADKFSSSFFGNGLRHSGHLKHPNQLSKPAQDRLASQLQKDHGGGSNSHKMLILEEGMEFVSNVIDPEASQMIETRQFTVSEFCRWMRIPPHKVADLTNATFSNIEQQNIDYVTDSLTAWCRRWELEIWRKLFTEEERKAGFYVEHMLEGLLKGDIQTRYDAYSKLWNIGALSINDIRSKENMNPIDGGDKHYVPLNFRAIEDGNVAESAIQDMSDRISQRHIGMIADAMEKHGDDFNIDEFNKTFKPNQKSYIESVLAPYVR